MKQFSFIIMFFFISIFLLIGCDQSVEPAKDKNSIIQIPGCDSTRLGKTLIPDDSCFSYQFYESLIVDFCVSGNCCPDSNRFSTNHTITNDTIIVAVADTAGQLCRCVCTYILHGEFHDLPGNNYLFLVYQMEDSAETLLYAVNVHRN